EAAGAGSGLVCPPTGQTRERRDGSSTLARMLSDGTEVFIVIPNEAAPPEVRWDPEVLRTLGAHRRRSRRWLTRGAILLVVLAAATALAVWLRDRAGAKPLEQFVTARVERKDLRETVTATGTLSPLDSVEVGAE